MIYVKTQAGIGNKLKSLVTCLRMSDLYSDQVCVQFEHYNLLKIEQPNRPAQPKVITRMDGSSASVTGIKTGAWQLDLMPQDLLEPVLKQPKSFVLIRAKDSYSCLPTDSIDFQFDNISNHIIQAILPYWNQITYDTEILSEVDEICRTLNIHNRVGVHIRSQYENSKKIKFALSVFVIILIFYDFKINLNNYKSYIYKQSNLSIVCSNKSIRDFYHNWAKSFDEIFFKKICLNNNLMFN